MTTELIARARIGDGDAFRALIEPYRRELVVHCYRMMGSLPDAEDMVQNTLLSAWQHLDDFRERASIRTWLYRIATNQCLSALRSARRRPNVEIDVAAADLPAPTHRGEITWIEPIPDEWMASSNHVGPEARYELRESLSLAFVTAVQVLPARQRAVLILRDVLGYRAGEVAAMLDSTVDSVNSALKRARAALDARRRADLVAPEADSAEERDLVDKFVRAYESADVDALIRLLTTDVRLSMPPVPLEYHGQEAVERFYRRVFRHRRYALVPTRANGQPAFGAYLHANGEAIGRPAGLLVLDLSNTKVCAITRFDNDVMAHFGLPHSLAR
ncbi:RNA polymerase subunit sigma-70 [Mycolicibacterium obuense]|uniref:ECF RNA polymerase sigma factor SigG n=1 Tax=Mycolicibacterium obuense TaxID=1807 RepID=A0A0J6W8F3_9MYCO|nr:RNA polymerase subunit sigma-70 [Mycolicibacterium obuense]KMO77907.1 ECF RNA polymerase sigma factor SigG [Mycolicibacterium obuense]